MITYEQTSFSMDSRDDVAAKHAVAYANVRSTWLVNGETWISKVLWPIPEWLWPAFVKMSNDTYSAYLITKLAEVWPALYVKFEKSAWLFTAKHEVSFLNAKLVQVSAKHIERELALKSIAKRS